MGKFQVSGPSEAFRAAVAELTGDREHARSLGGSGSFHSDVVRRYPGGRATRQLAI